MSSPKPASFWIAPLFFGAVILVALVLRLAALNDRPFHTDEANNAYLLQDFFEGHYKYRGNDHHGPSLFYAAAAVLGPFGVKTMAQMEPWMLRGVALGASLLLAASAAGLRKSLGTTGTWAAAALLMIAAPFAYYGGLFLHELLLLLCVSSFLVTFWKARETGEALPAILGGLAAGLALATKETAAPILLLLVLTGGWGAKAPWKSLAFGTVSALATVLLLFSFFGTKPSHAFDLFKAVGPQVARGTGNEHAYPFYTYITWLVKPADVGIPWSSWLVLPLAGAGWWWNRSSRLAQTLGLWALGLVVLFSLIPYKTPWLALSWGLSLILLAGMAMEKLANLGKPWLWAGAGGVFLLLAVETRTRCVTEGVAAGNPLAYSPSSPDLGRLEKDLETLSAALPEKHGTLVQVIASDYWPLPWTLRHFPQTGFWSNLGEIDPRAILLVGPEHASHLAASGRKPQPYTIRAGVLIYLCPPLS